MGTFKTTPQIPFLNLFLVSAKNLNVPQIIPVVQLLICHVHIYVVAPIVRTMIVKGELTTVIVVKTNCLKMMK